MDSNVARRSVTAEDREAYANGAAFVDGQFVPIAEARVPILDWGFLRSDATYDMAHVWRGAFFRLEDHLDRFVRGMERLRMSPPYGRAQIREILVECVRLSSLLDGAISRVQRIQPGAVDPTVKNYHWLDLQMGLFEAYDHGGETVILTDGDENVVEGPGFNVFAIKDGEIFTPDRGVLEGVTRRTVIELSSELGIPLHARKVPAGEVREADEVFITSTAGGVTPVSRVDGVPLGE